MSVSTLAEKCESRLGKQCKKNQMYEFPQKRLSREKYKNKRKTFRWIFFFVKLNFFQIFVSIVEDKFLFLQSKLKWSFDLKKEKQSCVTSFPALM